MAQLLLAEYADALNHETQLKHTLRDLCKVLSDDSMSLNVELLLVHHSAEVQNGWLQACSVCELLTFCSCEGSL